MRLLQLFGGSKVMLALCLALAASTAAAAVAGKLYLGKRDALAIAGQQLDAERVHRARTAALWEAREAEIRALEAARIALADKVAQLEARGTEVRTEIRTQWRDRVVRESYPVAVECADEPMPASVIGLLKCAGGGGAGCALHQPAG